MDSVSPMFKLSLLFSFIMILSFGCKDINLIEVNKKANCIEYLYDMAIDSNDSISIVGNSETSSFVINYSKNGEKEWNTLLQSGTDHVIINSFESGYFISYCSRLAHHIAHIDTLGNLIWLDVFNYKINEYSSAFRHKGYVKDISNYSYSLIYTSNSMEFMKDVSFLLKYDNYGNLIDKLEMEDLKVECMSMDSEGFLYVGINDDPNILLKIDSIDLTEKWSLPLNISDNGCISPNITTVFSKGNDYVIICSECYDGSWGGNNFQISSYDLDGSLNWIAYEDQYCEIGFTTPIEDDTEGRIIIAGENVLKYDSDGNRLWKYERYTMEGGRANALLVDDKDNVYLTGQAGEWPDYEYLTVKLNSDGEEVWINKYDGGYNAEDVAIDLIMDSERNIYVTGNSVTDLDTFLGDACTIKYDNDGNELWVVVEDEVRYCGEKEEQESDEDQCGA